MCDCLTHKGDGDKDVLETVTLFRKCPKPYHPGKDITRPSSCDLISDKNDWIPIDSSQSDLGYTICDQIKRLSSSSSYTSSSKTYKFVSPRECECFRGEGEEEPCRAPVIAFEPCVEEEEVEEEPDVECTLMIVKPEATVYRKQIERRIFEEGFEIHQTRWLQLTPEQVSEFYSDKYGQLNFAHLVAYMASGPIIVHVLAKRRAVEEWRLLMGPTKVTEARLYYPDSIRAKYGRRGADFQNAVHGSNSREEAEREIHFFFPEFILEPLLRKEGAVDYLWETLNPVLVEALAMCCKVKPADPVLWLANWLISNNPNKPKLSQDLAIIPT
ncbi:nucleoside diphosphate kinase homolog 5 [Osmia lignaria lignaria]|uniref:nucleoside diphosphate kinase homolog 5 n=1 Tax=Osmia lignaria lignaria TaxID=1437193 RepID=UPI001478E7F5|nr:nucleoside diphosphate kinase homolog 5-like [Osmia lignaria]